MPKKIDLDYTLEDFYRDIMSDLKGEPTEGEQKNTKPIKIQSLLAKAKLGKKE